MVSRILIYKHFCFIIFYPFKVARLVKVTQTDSPYFKIISPHDVGHKVAPGMDTIFIIQFTPDEKKVFVVKTSHKQLHKKKPLPADNFKR